MKVFTAKKVKFQTDKNFIVFIDFSKTIAKKGKKMNTEKDKKTIVWFLRKYYYNYPNEENSRLVFSYTKRNGYKQLEFVMVQPERLFFTLEIGSFIRAFEKSRFFRKLYIRKISMVKIGQNIPFGYMIETFHNDYYYEEIGELKG